MRSVSRCPFPHARRSARDQLVRCSTAAAARWRCSAPGFIGGVADNDPSCVGTYAVSGASLGLATLWLAPLVWPMGAAVQIICGRIGMVGGRGLAEVVRRRYPRGVLYPVVGAVVVANTITLGADLAAIVDAMSLLLHRREAWLALPLAVVILAVQILLGYRALSRVFKLLTVALFAYVAAIFAAKVHWTAVAAAMIPRGSSDPRYVETIVALVGATLSPYIFFWQSSQEVELEKSAGRATVDARRGADADELRQGTIDVAIGMSIPSVLMFAVTLTTAATLFAAGRHDVRSAADAAAALTPLAGPLAGTVFAIGLIGTGLLAVPVLSASAAYALAEARRWRRGLDERWSRAKRFYGVIVASTLAGAAMALGGISPMRGLFLSSVLNGLVTPPLLVLVLALGRDRRVMGDQRIGLALTSLGALTALVAWSALVLLAWTAWRG